MKALRLEALGQLAVVDLPDPEPAPGEVRLAIIATGICGSDIHGFTGENGRRHPGQVMGHESVARIDALGEGVTGLTVGDIATFNPVVVPADEADAFAGREQMAPGKHVIGVAREVVSSFAQQIVVPARNVVALPASMPVELGALIEPLAVSVHAVRRSGAAVGDRVVVAGGGPIGQSVVLALQMAGIERIAVTELSASRRALVERLGATALDAAGDDAVERIRAALGGEADVAIDAVGIEPTLRTSLRATRIGGTVCLVGMGAPKLALDAFLVSTEERTIVGSFTYSAQDFRDAAAWIGQVPPQAAALISKTVPLSAGHDAFAELAAHADIPGKVLIRMDDRDASDTVQPDTEGEQQR
ncbi:zinc-dependent alcohol dehydrogenase [Agrococcus baldri]|uniref:Galactitol-1-phosphate 5-dehydrogenase n=1 Tax=Agrococcus baldri TaxID=153730 RepID=A0AA87RGJ8_9MICO|nr:zinc-binding dehydrogenase [Agrococcus baldri]GEK79238.1 galactitol-1-phosphate 5-dehydrogenase [Agrococcus baldri]